MNTFCFIPVLTILFFAAACKGQINSGRQSSPLTATVKPFNKEIPTYKDGSVDLFYALVKAKQKQLGLDSLESGVDGLEIRVWYDFSLVGERKLVIITNKEANWAATVYDLQVDWDGKTETILSKQVRPVTPKSGWEEFSKKLLERKVLTLPDQGSIPEYGFGLDGRTYNVEIATKHQYRFYGYWEPQHNAEKLWQAKNMTDILSLFERELGV